MNKTNNKYNNNNKENNNNIIIVIRNTDPGVLISPEDGERILDAYLSNVAPSMTRAVADMIEGAIATGLSVDDVIDAINRTGMAPRPSPRYLRAVLRNYDKAPKPQPAPAAPAWWQRNPALDYEQRDYSGQTFEDDSWMEEAKKNLTNK